MSSSSATCQVTKTIDSIFSKPFNLLKIIIDCVSSVVRPQPLNSHVSYLISTSPGMSLVALLCIFSSISMSFWQYTYTSYKWEKNSESELSSALGRKFLHNAAVTPSTYTYTTQVCVTLKTMRLPLLPVPYHPLQFWLFWNLRRPPTRPLTICLSSIHSSVIWTVLVRMASASSGLSSASVSASWFR